QGVTAELIWNLDSAGAPADGDEVAGDAVPIGLADNHYRAIIIDLHKAIRALPLADQTAAAFGAAFGLGLLPAGLRTHTQEGHGLRQAGPNNRERSRGERGLKHLGAAVLRRHDQLALLELP